MSSRKIKITSNGVSSGTLITTEDGESIKGITHLTITAESNRIVEAVLTIAMPNVSVSAEVSEIAFACPCCERELIHECKKDFDTSSEVEMISIATIGGGEKLSPVCPDHKPVQHRDRRPPWCEKCGMTADFKSFENPPQAFRD